jgi:uncharacterized delta-60 repeat protein
MSFPRDKNQNRLTIFMEVIMQRFLAVTCILFSLLAIATPQVNANVTASPGGEIHTFSQALFTTSGKVNVLIPLSSGKMLAGGSFIAIGGQAAPRSLAILNNDGSLDTAFQVDPDLQVGEVTAAAMQDDGKIVLAGVFHFEGDPFDYYYLRLNADGSIDNSFYLYAIMTGRVYSVLVDGTTILLGGNFTGKIARLDSTGHIDASFNGTGTGANGAVWGMAKQGSQYILVGEFTEYNGSSRVGLARINTNGSLDTTFAPSGTFASRQVAVLSNNSIVVGTENECGGNVFRWYAANGGAGPTPSQDPNSFQGITALLPLSDGGFLIGGWYSLGCVNSSATAHEGQVWRFAANGTYSTMTTFGDEADILSLAVRGDGKVVVGGQGRPSLASQIGIFDGLALLDLASGLNKVTAFHPLVGDEAEIYDLSSYADGRLLVAGNFSHVNGQARFGLARLLASGGLDSTFTPFANQPNGWSNAALALPDNRAIAGFGDEGLYLIATNGSLIDLSAYNNYDRVRVLARQNDGKILVGSDFGKGVRRLKADFSGEDTTFQGGEAYGNVYALALQSDQKILVAGDFSEYDNMAKPGLVRLTTDGAIDGTFNPPTFLDAVDNPGSLYSVTSLTGGNVLVGGYFVTVNGDLHPSLARLNSNGSLDASFTGPSQFHTVKSTCAVGDSFWAGGVEESTARNPLVRHLDQSGTVDSVYGDTYQDAHDDGAVNKLLCSNSGISWGGGAFNLIDNSPYYSLARFMEVNAWIFLPLVVR